MPAAWLHRDRCAAGNLKALSEIGTAIACACMVGIPRDAAVFLKALSESGQGNCMRMQDRAAAAARFLIVAFQKALSESGPRDARAAAYPNATNWTMHPNFPNRQNLSENNS